MSERYLCIHGHFYQPPRENPWLEAVELQDSAYPYHDWNERITDECYAANASSRILDDRGRIVEIANNYSRISFNFGPTLLAWLEKHEPRVYELVLQADEESRKIFSGHGSALAQPFNHMILPLANRRDKYTQIAWGIRDFEHRFGRKAEGMWLPETAVDIETLEIMVELGLHFTVLAPHQARRTRRIGESVWHDVTGARIDPRRPYLVRLPSGHGIAAFFYDGPVSRAVAFERLLANGENFARRLLGLFSEPLADEAQLVHIATDGETYGHHHFRGEMALSYALRWIEEAGEVRITNYGEFLEKHPPEREAEIVENSSWSCVHGIERWRNDCGCHTGGDSDWNQSWRAPLRAALDWLRDELAPHFEAEAGRLIRSPWMARDEYIELILDRSEQRRERFVRKYAPRIKLDEEQQIRLWKLLEMQRHAMLMYTSCGWFFNELSGIETVQVMRYAGRAVQLGRELFDVPLEEELLRRLEAAPSNLPQYGNGRTIYEKLVRPAEVDLLRVGAHYAVSSLFEAYAAKERVYDYTVESEDQRELESGRSKLAVGRALIRSVTTTETLRISFGVLHFGDQNLSGGVREYSNDENYEAMVREVIEAFGRMDFPEIIRLFDRHFGTSLYSLGSLFRDEQRKVTKFILENTIEEAEAMQQQFYDRHQPLMRFLASHGIPIPKAFYVTAEFVLNSSLHRALAGESLDGDAVRNLLQQAESTGITLDEAGLGYEMERRLDRVGERFREAPGEAAALDELEELAALSIELPFEVDLREIQNDLYEVYRNDVYAARKSAAEGGDDDARRWVERFTKLGEKLGILIG